MLFLASAGAVAWFTVGPPPSGFGLQSEAVTAAIRSFTVAERQAANAYQSSIVWPILFALASSTAVALILGFSRAGHALVRGVHRLTRGRLTAVATAAVLTLIGSAVALPFDFWAYQVRRDAGLVVADTWTWCVDKGIALGISLAVTVFAVAVVLLCVRTARRRWWVPAAALAGVGVLVAVWAYPVIVEPLFTRTTPISQTAFANQEKELIRLARSDGFTPSEILVSNASAKTTTFNAYVSGYSGRIVIFDNLLKSSTPERVRMVVAHELGHATKNDVLVGASIAALAVMGFVALLGAMFSTIDAWAIPRVFAVVALASVLALPATNFISRGIEWRADEHALALTRDPQTFVEMQRELAVANKSALDPAAWRYWWFFTHPTSPQRIAFGEDWPSGRY